MAVAIERGRKPEIDYPNGEVVRRAAQHGIQAPLNRELVSMVHELVAKRAKPGLDTLYGCICGWKTVSWGTTGRARR